MFKLVCALLLIAGSVEAQGEVSTKGEPVKDWSNDAYRTIPYPSGPITVQYTVTEGSTSPCNVTPGSSNIEKDTQLKMAQKVLCIEERLKRIETKLQEALEIKTGKLMKVEPDPDVIDKPGKACHVSQYDNGSRIYCWTLRESR